jgi:hypothetical protein
MTGFVPSMTGFVLNMDGFVLIATELALNMTGFALIMTGFVLYVTVFVLYMYVYLYNRPCKIWASYGGRCVEKILTPKSKYIDTSKPGSKNCLGHSFLMV